MRNDVVGFGMLLLLLLPLLTAGSIKTAVEKRAIETRPPPFVESQYTPHQPVRIISNEDFAYQGWPGAGTESNPYLIHGLNITSDWPCIEIRLTDVHFKISDCSFGYASEEDRGAGVSLYRVQNAVIQNCEFVGVEGGIWAEKVTDVLLRENSFDVSVYGIVLSRSVNCTLVDNEFQKAGLSITGNKSQHFMSNCFSNNTVESKPISVLKNRSSEAIDASSQGQLFLFNSTDCIVENATFDHRTVGVSLALCDDCIVRNVNSTDVGECLVELQLCSNTEVTECSVAESHRYGFRFSFADSCALTRCSSGYAPSAHNFGIRMTHTQGTTIAWNTFWVAGIFSVLDINCSIVGNNIEGKANLSAPGVFLLNSCNFTLMGNDLHGLDDGLEFVMSSMNVTIFNNHIHDNRGYGIELSASCEDFWIYNNSFWDNEFGNALDCGASNYWDDNVSLGNQWDDYNGTGVYSIPGSAGSVDHFPMIDSHHTTSTEPITTTSTTPGDGLILSVMLSAITVTVLVGGLIISFRRRE